MTARLKWSSRIVHAVRGKNLKIAVIGAGKIGEAVARCIASSSIAESVMITKRNPSTLKLVDRKIRVISDNAEAAAKADVLIIAVKPGDAGHALAGVAEHTSGKTVISLMAAIKISRLQSVLPGSRIVRAMPNIAATIGESMTAYSMGEGFSAAEAKRATDVMSTFGECIEVKESLMDAITALSGSGPAYIAIIIDAMVSAGLKVGIPRDVAFRLVAKTLTGTANLLSSHPMHPAELRDAVTTPAGTTIAGIYELEKGSVRTSIMNAVDAATDAARKVAASFDSEPDP